MGLEIWYVKTQTPGWLESAQNVYEKKLNSICPVSLKAFKSISAPRSRAEFKIQNDDQAVLKSLGKSDRMILLDEKGRSFRGSLEFAQALEPLTHLARSKRVVFFVGGAYGVGQALRERADEMWSLSSLTMNHHAALFVLLEQIYRGLTILKGIPYHNA